MTTTQPTNAKETTMTKEITRVTWNETYNAAMGNQRFVEAGSRTFQRQSEVDRLVATLNDPGRLSIHAGRAPKIEDLKITTETIRIW
jgi:hypothetical protein